MRRVNQDRFRAARKARKSFAERRACEGLSHEQAPILSFYCDKEWLFGVLSSYFAFCRSPCGLAQGTTGPHLSYGASHKRNKPNDQTHSRERSSREPKGLSRAKTAANLKQTVLFTPSLACQGLSLPPKCQQLGSVRIDSTLKNHTYSPLYQCLQAARVSSSHSNSSAKTTRRTQAKGTTDSSSPASAPSKHDLHAATPHPWLSMQITKSLPAMIQRDKFNSALQEHKRRLFLLVSFFERTYKHYYRRLKHQ